MPITFCENCESTECRCEGGSVEIAAKPMEASLGEVLKNLIGTRDDPNAGWRGAGDQEYFRCEYCGQKHIDCTQIPHTKTCPIPAAFDLLDALQPLSAQAEMLRFPGQSETDAEKNAKAAIARATTVPNEANHG